MMFNSSIYVAFSQWQDLEAPSSMIGRIEERIPRETTGVDLITDMVIHSYNSAVRSPKPLTM
jgi:hypothetical protein